MANLRRTVLGIEISTRELRLVEMRAGNPPQILRASAVPLPAGAMDNDRVVQADAIADIIRGLCSRLGCQSRTAIVGMGIQSVVTRILAIPRVPDSELRYVLEGELVHYQILRSGTGAFDYFRLDAASPGDDALPSVLLMAVEDRIAQGYRLAVEKAGLQMLALEPVSLALLRASYPMLEAEPATLCLAITPQRSELSILDHGQIRLYRRLELGSNDFLRGRKAAVPAAGPRNLAGDTGPLGEPASGTFRTARFPLVDESDTADLEKETGTHSLFGGGSGPLPPLGTPGAGASNVIPQVAVALADEVQRSLDYYRREYPNATAIGRIILPTNDPEAEVIREWLAQTLRMDVRLAELPSDPTVPRLTPQEATQNLQYLGAAGLAMHALTSDWRYVPRFNLSPGGQAAATPIEKDRLTAVMIMAICILLGGYFIGTMFGRETQRTNHLVTDMRTTLGLKQRDFNDLEKRMDEEKTLQWIIKSDGLPIPKLLDFLTQYLPPGVGLTNTDFQRDGHIVIEGTAREPNDFTNYYLTLTTCPYFVNLRYQSLNTDPSTRITRFRLEASLVGTKSALGGSGGSL